MTWLHELHRQWMQARRSRTTTAQRAFRRDWEDLLDAAGLHRAEDRKAALREAEQTPQLTLHRLRGRPHIILKIELPVESEAWLHQRFGTQNGADAQQQALAIVQRWGAKSHDLLPDLCARLAQSFAVPNVVGPFHWREHEQLEELLSLVFHLASREWPDGTLIRDASMQLGHHSKWLEDRQSFIERALEQLFGRETPLEALGIQTANSVLHYSGPLVLHYADGSCYESDSLRFESTLSVAELQRATHITTKAERLLTVENRKTTFLQIARADEQRSTLVVATSFPTQAVKLLLQKLPITLEHYHFGDTDPTGWDILRKLRALGGRSVTPFAMEWRTKETAKPLTKRDHSVLHRLLSDSTMIDCHSPMAEMLANETKGDYEQESHGSPSLREWPFFDWAFGVGCEWPPRHLGVDNGPEC